MLDWSIKTAPAVSTMGPPPPAESRLWDAISDPRTRLIGPLTSTRIAPPLPNRGPNAPVTELKIPVNSSMGDSPSIKRDAARIVIGPALAEPYAEESILPQPRI